MRPDYMRQTDWYDPERHEGRVAMIGCGGIGSAAALALAKLGIPHMTLVDPDIVEPHNLPNQMFPLNTVGEAKVEALATTLTAMRGDTLDVSAIIGRIDAEGAIGGKEFRPSGIVVSGLDSMEARYAVWHSCIRPGAINVPLYIDARLGGERIVLYAINPMEKGQRDLYEETLYSDDEAREDPCSRRSIIDVSFATAALITRAVRKHLVGELVEPVLVHNQETFMSVKQDPRTVQA